LSFFYGWFFKYRHLKNHHILAIQVFKEYPFSTMRVIEKNNIILGGIL